MITGATPLISTPFSLATTAELSTTRADDSAKSEFAAILTAMLNPMLNPMINPLTVVPVTARLTLGTIADATTTDDSAIESEDETATAHETTGSSESAATASTATSTDVSASASGLDADFSKRLLRVLDRMRDAGHKVEVRETVRSTERQEALYAQGRTTTGPVVTWTLDSRHIEGKAAASLAEIRCIEANIGLNAAELPAWLIVTK